MYSRDWSSISTCRTLSHDRLVSGDDWRVPVSLASSKQPGVISRPNRTSAHAPNGCNSTPQHWTECSALSIAQSTDSNAAIPHTTSVNRRPAPGRGHRQARSGLIRPAAPFARESRSHPQLMQNAGSIENRAIPRCPGLSLVWASRRAAACSRGCFTNPKAVLIFIGR